MAMEHSALQGPPARSDVARAIDLLSRDDVHQAVLFAAASPARLDDLADLPVPAGMTRQETVDLITEVNRLRAIYSPIPDHAGRLHWYVYTHLMRLSLTEIDRYCTVDSRLYEEATTRSGARFLIQSNVDEAICAAQLDGVPIDYESAKDLLLMQRQPRTPAERLVLNQFQLGERLEEMCDRPWTPEALHGMYAQLTAGVPGTGERRHDERAQRREAVLKGLCEYASSAARVKCEHPAVTALILRAVIVYWQPFPAWNGMMARLVFRFYALKKEYPVLGYIPISRSEMDLAQHVAGVDAEEPQEPPAHTITGHHEADATAWLTVQLSLMTHALRQFRSRMRRAEVIDEAVRTQLQTDTTLNHRQRSIIGRALRVPGATFRIGYHRTTHGIGYATAHRDFASLVEQGYLVQETHGKAIIFTAAPDLEERMGSMADVGRVEDFDVDLPPELLSLKDGDA